MKKKKKIIIVCIVIVAIIIISLITALAYKGKTGKLPFEPKEEIKIVKIVENDGMKVTLSDVATAGDYIIIEYNVDLKENQADEYSDYINGLEYNLERTVKVDGKTISEDDTDTQQLAYRVSDNEIKIYDVIETKKIADTYKLEVDVYDTDLFLSNDDEVQDDLEYDNVDVESEEVVDLEEIETEETEETDDNYEEVTIDSEEYFANQENTMDNESEELVTPYTDISMQDMDESESEINNDDEKLGTLRVELKKSDTDQKAKIKSENIEETQDDVTTKVNKIIETDTAKFIIADTEQKNVTEELFENEIRTPENFEINVQDENGNTIKTCKRISSKIYNEQEQEWNGNGGESEIELNTGTAKIQTIIGLVGDNKKIKNIKLQPLYYQYITGESEEDLNNKTWYEIKNGTYTNKNQYDGTVEISKIEIENNLVKFYFDQKGLIPSMESIIIIRNKDSEMGDYIVPRRIYQTEAGKYIAEFKIGQDEYEDVLIPNIENAEFAIFENNDLEKIGKEIMLEL